jgi:hypothetical protein
MMVIVVRLEGAEEREDRYEGANTCRVDSRGTLTVLRGTADVVAAYPDGQWLRASNKERGGRSS